MCVVSMVMDSKTFDWQQRYYPPPVLPLIVPVPVVLSPLPTPLEIEEFRRLLERAREYDRKHGEPGCELETKRQKLRKLAETLGVAIDFV